MAGNAVEYCADWYADYGSSCWRGMSANNPICNDSSFVEHTVRGGSLASSDPVAWRSASRRAYSALYVVYGVGFRCARTPLGWS
jgi:formylglycine-generating enzyme required for sulfatase activity